MPIRTKLKLSAIFMIMALFAFFSGQKPHPALAGTDDNVSGWAWNPVVGWISFNCTEGDSDCIPGYGTKIDIATGYFSGYAWNDMVGWISFYRSDTNNPPSDDPGLGSGPIAVYDSDLRVIKGWAKILSMGDNGWIRFDAGSAPVTYDMATKKLKGWAWNGNSDGTGIGWISFNSVDCDANNNGFVDLVCGGNDSSDILQSYAVSADLNARPTVTDMTAPNIAEAEACSGGALRAKLDWKFNDTDQGATMDSYRLIVKKNSDNITVFDSGKCKNGSCIADCTGPGNGLCSSCTGWTSGQTCSYTVGSTYLSYDTAYKWSVEVWDNEGGSSNPVAYNVVVDEPVFADDDIQSTFTTYKSEFPDVFFSWLPTDISAGEAVLFDSRSTSQYYTFGNIHDCTDSTCDWEWIYDFANIVVDNETASSTIVTFINSGVADIELKLTDTTTNYWCSTSTESLSIKQKLPEWIEVSN